MLKYFVALGPQPSEMLRPEKTSQNRAGRKMAEENIKKL